MTSDDYNLKREYKGLDPIVTLTAAQINRILDFGSKKQIELFEESVDRLIDILPPEMEKTVLEFKNSQNIVYDTGEKGKDRYVALFRFIKHQLSKDNIVWKRSSFEIGSE